MLSRVSPFVTPSTLRHGARTALAATITVGLTRVLELEQGYWAVFSAILVMQTHVGASVAVGWARLIGTAAGAFLGALASTGTEAFFGPGMVGLALAMAGTTFVCALLATANENLRLAGLTAAVVICLHAGGQMNAFVLGLNRFLEVGLGVVVALGVSLAWPSRARVVLRHGLAKGLELLAALLAALMESRLSGRYDRQRVFHGKDSVLRLSLRNRQLLGAARRERGPAGQEADFAAQFSTQDRLAEHLLAMDHAIEAAPPEGFHRHLEAELAELGAALGAGLTELARAVGTPDRPSVSIAARLNAALDAAGLKLLDLRQQRVIAVYDLDEVMHFYSFYHALREAAREVLAELERRDRSAGAQG